MAAEKKKKKQQQQQHHSHRPTQKQQNKPFKSRYATKAELKDRAKGKVERVSLKSAKVRHAATKADRRNAARLEQKKKRFELVKANRVFDGRRGAPKIIAVVPLCPDVSPSAIIESAFRSGGAEAPAAASSCHFTLATDSLKQRLQFLRPTFGGDAATRDADLTAVLDAVKVADFVMFVVSAKEEVDEAGLRALSAIMAQGVPGVFTAVQHLGEVPQKKQSGVRKSLVSFMSHFFAEEEKVHPADAEADMLALVRLVAGQTPKTVTWREPRAYMLVEEASFVPNAGDVSTGTLRVTGYVRGRNFDSSRLVHLQDFGDFQVAQITSAHADNSRADGEAAMEIGDAERVLDVPDPEDQDDLVSENVPDPLANEQTWPTEEEIAEADLRMEKLEDERKAKSVRVPKGTSSYQAAWAVIDDREGGSEDGTEGDDDDDDEAMLDDGEGSDEEHGSGEHARSGFDTEEEEEYEDVEVESRTATSYARTEEISSEEEERQMCEFMAARRKAHKDEMAFPDEIDTPMSTPARIRFQRYRGLQSFRTSPWDPYENLPLDYSRIFQFANFRRFRNRALRSDSDKGVPPGTRVHVYVRNVPGAFMATYSPSRVYPLFQLKRHEHKMSVLNFSVVRPSPDDDDNGGAVEPDIIKSKDPLVLHCAFRRYRVRPIFSASTRHSSTTDSEGRANKFERFLKPGAAAVATVFAPVQMTPAPAALYLEKAGSAPKLVATGTFLDVEPRRIVAKRVVLTGAPFKVHKRICTVRYMFFNPDDVLWFKPVQVHTKHGRVGHIRESLGTHGYMKCLFDGPITQQDVVCMNLYKRVFPKWNTTLWRRPEVERALGSEGPDGEVQVEPLKE